MHYWLEIALMYHRKGLTNNFALILDEALRDDLDRMSHRHLYDDDRERIKAMNVLAGH